MDEPQCENRRPWPLPEEAAAGALDRVSVDHWPRLAAYWLAAGFDSEPLRQLAELQSREAGAGQERMFKALRTAQAALVLMPEALRSIGADPAPTDEEFVAHCQDAVDVVQRDLNATGYGRYQLRARLGLGWPAMVYPALRDGSYWGGTEGIKRETAGVWLLFSAAELVSDTLREVPEVEFPVCVAHGGDPMTTDWDGEDRVMLFEDVVWWRCSRAGHALAPVGQLTAKVAKTLPYEDLRWQWSPLSPESLGDDVLEGCLYVQPRTVRGERSAASRSRRQDCKSTVSSATPAADRVVRMSARLDDVAPL
jgi:hypothetical protein